MEFLPLWCHVRLMLWLWILSVPSEVATKTIIRLGYITGSARSKGDFTYRKPGQLISGAITLAVEEINKDPSVLPNHTLEFMIAETYGKELQSIRQTAVLPSMNISAYVGPQETCVHEGRIAAAFNLPMVSYVSIIFLCQCWTLFSPGKEQLPNMTFL